MKTYNSVAQMKLSFLIAGQKVETLGFYVPGDGGAAPYLIEASQAVDGFGDHTLAGTTVAILQPVNGVINVKQYGAVADGATDGSAAFISALAAHASITVPASSLSYVVDVMVEIAAGKAVTLEPGVIIERVDTVPVTPVFWLSGQDAVLRGGGANSIIKTASRCGRGVVQIGNEDMTNESDTVAKNHISVSGFTVNGSIFNDTSNEYGQTSGLPDIGIWVCAPLWVNGAVFYGHINNLWMEKLNYGITMDGNANAFTGNDIHTSRLGNPSIPGAGIIFRGGLENIFDTFFHDLSPSSTAVQMERLIVGARTYNPQLNIITIATEGAGAGSSTWQLDANASNNFIKAGRNTPIANDVDLGINNTIEDSTRVMSRVQVGNVFTPSISFSVPGDLAVSYDVQTGFYTVTRNYWGTVVQFNIAIITTSFTHTTASGGLQINLPIAGKAGQSAFAVSVSHDGWTKAGYTNLCGLVGSGSAVVNIKMDGSGVSSLTLTAADMPTGTNQTIYIAGHYISESEVG